MTFTAILALIVLAPSCAAPEDAPEPRLAVVLIVDQLTPELVERYDPAFEHGFRRLLDEGLRFSEAVHDHAITFTGPGHASLATGAIPARHGIVGNSWREREGDGWIGMNADTDREAELVGGEGPGASPRNLLVDGIGDWWREQWPEARIVTVAGKAPVAVLMAGRGTAGESTHAYWYSSRTGGFVTSDHYRPALPEWVEAFNAGVAERLPADQCWRSEVSAEAAALSRPDTVEYEFDGTHTSLPHCVSDEPYGGRGPQLVAYSPFLDLLAIELAKEAVVELSMGAGAAPDYLAVGLSSTDRVGHRFGPFSREQLDNLLRLDREIGELLAVLDERVGRGAYVVGLSSDHGVLPMPEHLEAEGRPGRRVSASGFRVLRTIAEEVAGGGEFELDDGALLERFGADDRARLARAVENVDWVEQAFPLEVLAGDAPAAGATLDAPLDPFLALYRNSFHPDRFSVLLATFGVELRLSEGVLTQSSGTTHGAPYLHDRAVPLLFAAPGLEPGVSDAPARTVDFAPTLAELMGLRVPEGLDGRSLSSEGR